MENFPRVGYVTEIVPDSMAVRVTLYSHQTSRIEVLFDAITLSQMYASIWGGKLSYLPKEDISAHFEPVPKLAVQFGLQFPRLDKAHNFVMAIFPPSPLGPPLL